MTDLPNGPLPDVSALKPRVRAILEEVGTAISVGELCQRLEGEYKINMKSHMGAVKVILYGVINEPATRAAVAKAKTKRAKAKRGKAKREEASRAKQKNEPKPPLSKYAIFRNEKRDVVVEASRARGEAIDAVDIEAQISTLWRTLNRRDGERYREIADEDKECYADEKATFEDAAPLPAAHDVAPPRWAPVPAVAASAYKCAIG
jgi:pyruvate/2-oxoglutarate dehydrogenase complex dihydrolipoamide acyltransferase (E2) component